jgi:hypothetical protein
MAISVDTVYQTVLALANKEQRGYITPQEFNLFANQAQVEIFEQYFYDLNQFKRGRGSDDNESDMVSLLEDKIAIFSTSVPLSNEDLEAGNSKFTLPSNFYRLTDVRTGSSHSHVQINKLSRKDFWEYNQGPLTKGTLSRPNCYLHQDGVIWVNPDGIEKIYVNYIRKLHPVSWGYLLQGNSALWNPTTSNDFELHPSEQNKLVLKILKLAGVSIKDAEVSQLAAQQEVTNLQQQKS